MADVTHEGMAVDERLPGLGGRRKSAGLWLVVAGALAAALLGFAYANAGLLVRAGQQVGLLASGPAAAIAPEDLLLPGKEAGREIEVIFTAQVNGDLPIAFSVNESRQTTRVNQYQINDYRFTNLSRDTIYFRPVHDVYPQSAGSSEVLVLRKCFCFDMQKIGPGESYTLPVEYAFNEGIEDGVDRIRMVYTLTTATREQYEAAQEQEDVDHAALKEAYRTP